MFFLFEATRWVDELMTNVPDLHAPGQNYVSVYRGTRMWDDAHSFKTRSFLCYDSSVSLEEEIQYGCNEQEEFGKICERMHVPSVVQCAW